MLVANSIISPKKSFLETICLKRKDHIAWALYDSGNSAFALVMMTAILPTYFANVAAVDLAPNIRTAYWGYTTSAAMFLIALFGPFLGVLADLKGIKKQLLAIATLLGVTGSALLFYVQSGDWLLASLFFILGNLGFAAAEIFYESLLPHLASPEELDQLSTTGYAMGYLFSAFLLMFILVFIMKFEAFGLADKGLAVRISFVLVAVWWALFTLPLLFFVREPPSSRRIAKDSNISSWSVIVKSFGELAKTFREIKRYKNAFIFLLAFWAYGDGVGTIIKMATIYGMEVGIDSNDLILAILAVQFIAVPATIAFGYIARRIGAKNALYITLWCYCLISILGYFMTTAWHFWILAMSIGCVQGAVQALSRSLFARMIPRGKSAEFFGFYGLSAKFAGILGPLIFALSSQFFGTSRISIVLVVFLFLIGIMLLRYVNIEEGIAAAAE